MSSPNETFEFTLEQLSFGAFLTNATSVSSIRLQKQLFRCLVYQTIFPMLTAYFPAAYCIFAPILGFSWPPISSCHAQLLRDASGVRRRGRTADRHRVQSSD
ncbi:hypothetical protein PRIPAC_80194 [Pristionchus pacificus]|uniref:G protein-coupled receptor n=1 Tax=Pristionchus pacificus TaxID=54126 RepID=A0A2A6CPP7_PRIPA|nr:hypothetical protein PRIPAC_80194 [Pristionchus pacificus]|eukprot:PDM80076.1 G protein-coupled receptor [Pristionchus pacificus]